MRSVLALLLLTTPALAQDFGRLPALLPPEKDALACWARIYDAAHLAAHPHQKVSDMRLTLQFEAIAPSSDWPDGYGEYTFELLVGLRDGVAAKANGGCYPNGDTVNCGVECDGGGVFVSHASDGESLLVDLESIGFIRMTSGCEGSELAPIALEAEPDDGTFLLRPLPADECVPLNLLAR